MNWFITVAKVIFLITAVVLTLSAAGTKDELSGERSMILAIFMAALTCLLAMMGG